VPIGCLNSRELPVNAGESPRVQPAENPAGLQGIFGPRGGSTFCLPCRRSWVRIPSAASQKACICRPFWSRQSPCSSASGRTETGLAPGRSWAVPQKTPVCRPILVRPNPSPSAGYAEGRVFACCGRYPDSCSTARPSGQRPPARYQRWRHFGPVRFQSETRRSTSARSAATPGEHGTESRELLRETASDGASRSR
jgi:hypothetical protein